MNPIHLNDSSLTPAASTMIRDHDPSSSAFAAYQNTYLRRSSPPGSPAIKKCCYEHEPYTASRETSFFCCCYTCPSSRSTSTLATLGVCFLVLSYTILGAFVFMALEGGWYQDTEVAASKSNPGADHSAIGELRAETVDRLWSITENLNILYRENWTRLAAEEVLTFQEALFKALRNSDSVYVSSSMGTMTYYQNLHKWSFSSSFLYSLTLITTIGYYQAFPNSDNYVYAPAGLFSHLGEGWELMPRQRGGGRGVRTETTLDLTLNCLSPSSLAYPNTLLNSKWIDDPCSGTVPIFVPLLKNQKWDPYLDMTSHITEKSKVGHSEVVNSAITLSKMNTLRHWHSSDTLLYKEEIRRAIVVNSPIEKFNMRESRAGRAASLHAIWVCGNRPGGGGPFIASK
ncbi:hypothetical protein NQ317_017825 [Molorchus minor]|uniref:Uncharacterized protein n=1 Tax=Molorchus minor TaxID=1323400 RepID=A0ABQ9K3M2_9CUCU|nr:hypothetical protein NQ317_017825 [Molorchus minor]